MSADMIVTLEAAGVGAGGFIEPPGESRQMPILIVSAAVLGLLIGSFLNVVIYRLPRHESLVSPASHCPHCDEPVRTQHNIPVFGWLILRGRCADCKARISVRYPLVELATGLLFVAVSLRLADLELLPALPAYAYFTAIGVALTMIDIDVRRLPNRIVFPSYLVIGLLLVAASLWSQDWWALARAGIGGIVLFGFYFLLALIYPAGMGFGDVKLAGILGAVLGYLSWAGLVFGAFAGFLLGGIAGVAMLVSGRANRKTALPFGPFMLVGAMGAIFVGDPVAGVYLRAVGWA